MIPSPAETVRKNPNATLGFSLTPIAGAVAWGADRAGITLEPWQAAGLAGGILTTGLWIGKAGARCAAIIAKRGVVGLWRSLLHGSPDGS